MSGSLNWFSRELRFLYECEKVDQLIFKQWQSNYKKLLVNLEAQMTAWTIVSNIAC